MSISGEIAQQVTGAMELSAETRTGVEETAELLDAAVARLGEVLATSTDQSAEQAVHVLAQARQRLGEVSDLLGIVDRELPVFLARLGRSPGVPAAGSAAPPERNEEPVEYTAWWGTSSKRIPDAGDAESVIRDATSRFVTTGGRGVTIRIGDRDREQAPLRIDIGADGERAAVTWRGVPGHESGVDADRELLLDTPKDGTPVTVPAERARVTPEAAIRAAREYVSTGRRPTHLTWGPGDAEDRRTAEGRREATRTDRAASTREDTTRR